MHNFNQDDLEYFIKQKADQYQMYPSDRVWRKVYAAVHHNKRWFGLGAGLILLTILFFTGREFMFSNSPDTNVVLKPKATSQNTIDITSGTNAIVTGRSLKQGKVLADLPVENNHLRPQGSGYTRSADLEVPYIQPTSNGIQLTPEKLYSEIDHTRISSNAMITPDKAIKITPNIFPGNKGAEAEPNISKEIVAAAPEEIIERAYTESNWLQEMAAIRLTRAKKSAFNLQFYFSPTISYRTLSINQHTLNSNQQNIPLSSNLLNVDHFVDHRPSVGVELGSNILFSASNRLTIKTGLQLNYSRYSIKAYKYYFEKASITLHSAGRVADTITPYTSLRNFNGYSPEQLQNQYVQISMPIGAELKLLGNKKLQLNVAGTIQPTYLLYNDIYLLSTDYVNYVREPSLVRKWNVHTSVEAFLSYKMGAIRWQVGPQFRYQVKSSYNDRYPISEYLMEYGLKLGISKTLK